MGEQSQAIVPREKLDFGLDGDIPKYWFGGDPFKTRLFDAMSCLFPRARSSSSPACATTASRSASRSCSRT
jgi:hypothetical protein